MANILQLTVRHSPDPEEFRAVDPVSKIKKLTSSNFRWESRMQCVVCEVRFTKFF